MIWINTVRKGRVYPSSTGQGLIMYWSAYRDANLKMANEINEVRYEIPHAILCLSLFVSLSVVMQTLRVFAMKSLN